MIEFWKTKMNWLKVLLLSLGSAVVVAVLNCIPALQGTSFTVPAETVELWIVLAVFIIMNCTGYKDAMAKTFVFFLISQPLIYLIEVPFKEAGWSLFRYYPYWGFITVLTIPGAALAYRVKKDDIIAALILSLANILMIITGMYRIEGVMYEFPRYLLSVLFSLVMPVVMILALLQNKKGRVIALSLAAAAAIAGFLMFGAFPQDFKTSYPLDEGSWSIESVSDPGLTVAMDGEDELDLRSHKNGVYTVVVVSEAGEKIAYEITVEGSEHFINITGSWDITE